MSSHKREPVKHTCPDIDRYIGYIKMVTMRDRDLRNLNEEDLLETAMAMNAELQDCIEYFEELRSSNSSLREWGAEEAERVDILEGKIDDLEEQIGDLNKQLNKTPWIF
jgi:hypothetical protein